MALKNDFFVNCVDFCNRRIKVHEDYRSIAHGDYDLKKEVLGLEHLHMYDIYAPLIGELDRVYSLPYARDFHPDYIAEGGVPAITEVKFSITHNRGCFGACNFCAIAFHQGRAVRSRSERSVIDEARIIASMPDFKGYINDVGGPTANFRYPSCDKQAECGVCPGKKCLAPTPCKNLKVDHTEYAHMLREIENIKGFLVDIEKNSLTDISGYAKKLEDRILKFLNDNSVQIDEQRILTEVAIFADKVAIDEELVRLKSHFDAFYDIVSSNEPAGRKLDFLLQEMNRETNTIGSKASNTETAHLVVNIKNELEKIREQIQNIE